MVSPSRSGTCGLMDAVPCAAEAADAKSEARTHDAMRGPPRLKTVISFALLAVSAFVRERAIGRCQLLDMHSRSTRYANPATKKRAKAGAKSYTPWIVEETTRPRTQTAARRSL